MWLVSACTCLAGNAGLGQQRTATLYSERRCTASVLQRHREPPGSPVRSAGRARFRFLLVDMVSIDDAHGTFAARFYVESCWHEPNIRLTDAGRDRLDKEKKIRIEPDEFKQLASVADPLSPLLPPPAAAAAGAGRRARRLTCRRPLCPSSAATYFPQEKEHGGLIWNPQMFFPDERSSTKDGSSDFEYFEIDSKNVKAAGGRIRVGVCVADASCARKVPPSPSCCVFATVPHAAALRSGADVLEENVHLHLQAHRPPRPGPPSPPSPAPTPPADPPPPLAAAAAGTSSEWTASRTTSTRWW